jgi:hypothetical protein
MPTNPLVTIALSLAGFAETCSDCTIEYGKQNSTFLYFLTLKTMRYLPLNILKYFEWCRSLYTDDDKILTVHGKQQDSKSLENFGVSTCSAVFELKTL